MNRLMLKTFVMGGMLVTAAHAQTIQEGLRALDFDKYESARTIFTQLTKKEPANGDNWYYLGQSYLNLFKEDSAQWAYNEGVKLAPNNASNYVGLGELLIASNKVEDAKIQFNKALGFSRGRDGMIKDAKTLRLVASALVSTDTKVVDEALNHIKNALEIAPKDYEVLIAAGDVYLEMNKGGEAATQYERAEVVEPQNPKAFTRVAAIWLRVRNAEQTLTDLNKALAIDPNYAPALKLMSELYYKSKKYQLAKEYYTKYLNNSEPSLANQKRFAKILFNSKEYEDALPKIIDVIKLEDSDIYMHRLAGYSYYEVGELKKDTSMYRPGVLELELFLSKIAPDKILASDYEYLGKLYSRIPGKDSLAVIYMNKAIEMAPEKLELLKEAGMVYNKIKRFDKSIVCFENYISKTDKILPADYYLLGMASYFGKSLPKADSAFTKLIEIKPDYADGYYWRGNVQALLDTEAKDTIGFSSYNKYISMVEATPEKYKRNLIVSYDYLAKYYIKQEKNSLAKGYLEKIIALDPNNKQAKEYLKQIGGGK
jgi:tetratricopeptide (TPR) repeat protein